MQYRVRDDSAVRKVQVLALNAVTMQSMTGHREIYLIPAEDAKQIEQAADSLFQKYSR